VCLGGMVGYVGAAFVKMLAYASLVPVTEEWSLTTEVIQEAVGVLDILAIQMVLDWRMLRVGDKKVRMLGTGLGWATADALLSHFLIFVVNASGGEFTWEYLQRAFTANCDIAQYTCLACLVWITKNSKNNLNLAAWTLIIAKLAFPVVIGYASQIMVLDVWSNLALQGVFSVGYALFTKFIVEVSLY